jgi:hypothetical protein
VVPALDNATVFVMLLPGCALPKLKLAGDTANCACASQVPDNGIVELDSEVPWCRTRALALGLDAVNDALLLTDSEALMGPVEVGANVTLKTAFCDGDKTKGREGPVTWNAGLLTAACVTVMFVDPELVKVSVLVWVLPLKTLPKLTLAGEALNLPARIASPLSAMVVDWLAAPIATTAEGDPADCGVKRTTISALPPGRTANGKLGRTMLNSALVMLALTIVTATVPRLEIVSDT